MWKFVARLAPTKLMPNRLVPSPGMVRKLMLAGCVAGIAAGAFFWGWQTAQSQTRGQTKTDIIATLTPTSTGSEDYKRRVVAYIYGNVPVTREDLGEYLIARQGAERVEALVNRRILELVCQKNGVYVSDNEVQAQLKKELDSLGNGITEKDFANQILKRFNKTLYEWKEDVIRPRLALEKMVKPHINVSPADLQQAFDATYGPKVKCRMIVMAREDRSRWTSVYEAVKDSDEKFREVARSQFIPALAAQGGEVPPIHKNFGDERVEKEAFSLKVGQVGRIVEMKDGTGVILKCDGFLPADASVRMDDNNVRIKLHNDIYQYKLNQKVPEFFQTLKQQAAPSIILTNQIRQDELERRVQQEFTSRGTEVKGTSAVPDLRSLDPVDTSKLQGPPPGTIGDISELPSRPVSPPGTFSIPSPPPSGITPTSYLNTQPSPTGLLPAVPGKGTKYAWQ